MLMSNELKILFFVLWNSKFLYAGLVSWQIVSLELALHLFDFDPSLTSTFLCMGPLGSDAFALIGLCIGCFMLK